MGIESEGQRLSEQAAASAGLPVACIEARHQCDRDVKCRDLARSLVPVSGSVVPETFVSQVLQNCQGRAALLGALDVVGQCPGRLSGSAVRHAREDLLKFEDFCAHIKEIEQSLTSRLLPNLLTPAPFELTPKACVEAREQCSKDKQCDAVVSAQAGMTSDRMIMEAAELCEHKETMLRAVSVVADCPGALPGASARMAAESLRKDLSGIPGKSICTETRRLVSSSRHPVKVQNVTGEVLSLKCIKAHQRCGAEPKCGPAVDLMVKQSSSKERMLAEALKVCSSRSAMLLALEVSYECPGMLPAKEARESHDALALVPDGQLCTKMQELTSVLSVLLSPATSLDCKSAREECRGSAECGATWKRLEQHGDGPPSMTMQEIIKLCHDKHAMLTALRMVMECEDHFPRDVLRDTYNALEPVQSHELCSETQLLLGRLGPQALKTLTLSMSSAVVPMSCASAHQKCGASLRCGPAVIAMETKSGMSPSEQAVEMLKLCDNKEDFFAVLGVAAACPSNPLSQEMDGLRQLLISVPESQLCVEAVKYASDTLLPLAPPAVPPAACVQAHQTCSQDASCAAAVEELGRLSRESDRPGHILESLIPLCGTRKTFLNIVQVAVECPGPQPQEMLRNAMAVFNNTSDEDLCSRATSILKSESLSVGILDAATANAIDKALPSAVLRLASRAIDAFDRAPRDSKLNAVEMEALLNQLATEAGQSSGASATPAGQTLPRASSTAVNAFFEGINLQALDKDGNKLVEAKELATSLSPSVRPVLERLALKRVRSGPE